MMDFKTKLMLVIIGLIFLIGLVYVAYLIDTNKIAVNADVESDASITDLQKLPSPDESIISRIYSTIISPFSK